VKVALAAVLLLCALAAGAQAPPAGFSAMGGAVTVGTKGAPEIMLGYALASWPSVFKRFGGEGSIVGMVGKQGLALGIGHTFRDYESSLGRVALTLGPALYVPLGATHGLRDGQLRLMVNVSILPQRNPP
jgi:hypothetical protein